MSDNTHLLKPPPHLQLLAAILRDQALPLVPAEPEVVSPGPGGSCLFPTSTVSPWQLCCLPAAPVVSDLAWSRWEDVALVEEVNQLSVEPWHL